jgi:hypothetical protein
VESRNSSAPAADVAADPIADAGLWFHGLGLRDDLDMCAGDRAPLRAGSAAQRLVHDAADGARATPALRAATEASIDLVGGGRAGRGTVESGPHIAVAEDVAGTNDHYVALPLPGSNKYLGDVSAACKKKNAFWMDSKVLPSLTLMLRHSEIFAD